MKNLYVYCTYNLAMFRVHNHQIKPLSTDRSIIVHNFQKIIEETVAEMVELRWHDFFIFSFRDLSNNEIRSVAADAFRNLKSLKSL